MFIHSLVDGHLGFHFLAIMNNAAMSIGVFIFVWPYVFLLVHLGGIVGSYGSSVFNLNFLKIEI